MQVRFGEVEVSYSQRGNPTYRVELWHDGLKKHRLIKGSELEVIQRKAQLQSNEWMTKWEDTQAREAARMAREGQKALAAERTAEAQANLEDLARTLAHTLAVDDRIDWEQLKDTNQFSEPRPVEPRASEYPPEPTQDDPAFKVEIGFFDRFISSWREAKEAHAIDLYENAHNDWLQETSRLKKQHGKKIRRFQDDLAAWRHREQAFVDAQGASNAAIDRQRQRYENQEPGAIGEYYDLVLSRSTYPDWMPQEFDTSYTPDNGNLLVRYSLPSVDALPGFRR